jgi:hypothetical protein
VRRVWFHSPKGSGGQFRAGKLSDAFAISLLKQLIHITPFPAFPRLKRLDDRVAGIMKMPGGVLVLGLVAAADMPASQTEPQMHPGVPGFQALLAPFGCVRRYFSFGALEVLATFHQNISGSFVPS